ncbi:MAG: hypothetical protein WCA35_04795 [Kovacikia sp.]
MAHDAGALLSRDSMTGIGIANGNAEGFAADTSVNFDPALDEIVFNRITEQVLQ